MSKLDILSSLKEESKKDIKGSPLSTKHEEEPDFDNYIFKGSVSKKTEEPEETENNKDDEIVFDENFFSSFEEKKTPKKNKIESLTSNKEPVKKVEVIEEKEEPKIIEKPKEPEKKSKFESVFEENEEIPESLKNMKPPKDNEEPIIRKPGRKKASSILKETEKEDVIMPKTEFSPLEKKIIKKLLERAKENIELTEDDLLDQDDINYYFDKLKEIVDNT